MNLQWGVIVQKFLLRIPGYISGSRILHIGRSRNIKRFKFINNVLNHRIRKTFHSKIYERTENIFPNLTDPKPFFSITSISLSCSFYIKTLSLSLWIYISFYSESIGVKLKHPFLPMFCLLVNVHIMLNRFFSMGNQTMNW